MLLLLFFNVAFYKRLLPQTAFSVKSQHISFENVFSLQLLLRKNQSFAKKTTLVAAGTANALAPCPVTLPKKKLRHNAMNLCTQNKRTKRLFYRKIKKEEKFSSFFVFLKIFHCTVVLHFNLLQRAESFSSISPCCAFLQVYLQCTNSDLTCKYTEFINTVAKFRYATLPFQQSVTFFPVLQYPIGTSLF